MYKDLVKHTIGYTERIVAPYTPRRTLYDVNAWRVSDVTCYGCVIPIQCCII